MENIETKKITRGTFIKGAFASAVGAVLLLKNAVSTYAADTTPLNDVNKGRFEFDKNNSGSPQVVYDAKHLPYYFDATIPADGIVTITHKCITENSFIQNFSKNYANPADLLDMSVTPGIGGASGTLTLKYDPGTVTAGNNDKISVSIVNPVKGS